MNKQNFKNNNFEYQGRSRKQYEDSSKIFLASAIGFFTLLFILIVINN